MNDDGNRWVPQGVRDTLPAGCIRRRILENRILQRFDRCGYDEVRTPALEYLSLYQQHGGIFEGDVVKTFDEEGRILALRPDFTTPIARLVATRLKDICRPLRLCYLGVAFRNQHDRAGLRLTEFTQAGAELLGPLGADADAEIIALAASTLNTAGLNDYLIEIGQVDFFQGLMRECGLDDTFAEKLRVAVEQKNTLSVEMMLCNAGVREDVWDRIMRLPSLFGGPEVIEKARAMTADPRCLVALDNLERIYKILDGYGLSGHIALDLGMVHSLDYYTGVIFRGISGYLGAPILSGGRYDTLLDGFGLRLPATGFALGVERLIEALSRQDGPPEEPAVDVIVSISRHDFGEYEVIEALRAQNRRVELFYGTAEDLMPYAKLRGAKAAIIAQGEVVWL